MAGLRIEHLGLRFGGLEALAEINLEIEDHSVYAVIGPNGAGKTSFFNCITGYYRATSGSICFGEADITRLSAPDVAALGIRRTFQNVRIFPRLSALENVLAGAHLRCTANLVAMVVGTRHMRRQERELAEEAESLLAFVGLHHTASTLAMESPYGMRKRLEIARALMAHPTMLLLDEPAAGVSSMERDELSSVIRKAWERGITVVMIEHDVELVMQIATQVAVLDHSRLLAVGRPQEVRTDPKVVEAYIGRRHR